MRSASGFRAKRVHRHRPAALIVRSSSFVSFPSLSLRHFCTSTIKFENEPKGDEIEKQKNKKTAKKKEKKRDERNKEMKEELARQMEREQLIEDLQEELLIEEPITLEEMKILKNFGDKKFGEKEAEKALEKATGEDTENLDDEEFEELDERYHPQEDIGLEFREYNDKVDSSKDLDLDKRDLDRQSTKKKYLLNESLDDVDVDINGLKNGGKIGEKGKEEEEFEDEALAAFRARKEEILQSDKKKFPHFSRDYTKCRGCGIRLQSEREGELGYVPKDDRKKTRKKKRICQRCYYLRHHNKEPPLLASHQSKILQSHSSASQLISDQSQNPRVIAPQIESYREAVAKDVADYLREILPNRKCVVIHLFDLSDQNPESFLANINKTVGTNPVHYVGTKFDLLPHGASINRVRLWFQSLIESFTGNKVPLSHVHIVSAVSGQNVKNTILEIDSFRKGRDLFVVGCVNSGKSTFINSALFHLGIGGVKYDKSFGITTSRVPGTTLDAITLPLKTGGYLHDTPGLQIYSSVPSLTAAEAKLSLISKQIKPKILHIRPGKSIYFGGLGRIDYIEGPALYVAIFTARLLRVHLADTVDAATTQQKYVGKSLVPPLLDLSSSSTPMIDYRLTGEALFQKLNENRKVPLPPYTTKELIVEKQHWNITSTHSICDIVLPGVGWVSITGEPHADIHFNTLCMHPSGAFLRQSLMPFEGTREGVRHLGVTRYSELPSISIPFIKLPSIPKEYQHLPSPPSPPIKRKNRKERAIKQAKKAQATAQRRHEADDVKREILQTPNPLDIDDVGDRAIIDAIADDRE